MSLKIKQRNEKWEIEVSNEVWYFDSPELMMEMIKELVNIKLKYGQRRKDD